MRRKDGQPKRLKNPSPYGYGVTWRKRKKPYLAKITRKHETIGLGSYATVEEAQAAIAAFLEQERGGERSA